MRISIGRIREMPERDLAALVEASESEGFRFVRRLAREWQIGENRFSKAGEALFTAYDGDRLVGICGLNLDPYAHEANVARVRHLYVLPDCRGRGIGEKLTRTVISSATGVFRLLRLRTGTPEAAAFYEHLGFTRCATDPECTHLITLPQDSLSSSGEMPPSPSLQQRTPPG